MAIKKRKHVPNLQVQANKTSQDAADLGRSPELQGQRFDIWQFIEQNPLCSRDDVAKQLGIKSSTATARIKELIDLGYVEEPLGVRKRSAAGVSVRALRLTSRKAGAVVNERVRVTVTLTIDCNGNYGASAAVINGNKQSGRVTPIATKTLTLIAPPTASQTASNIEPDEPTTSRIIGELSEDDFIDGSYTIVGVE